MLSSLLIEFFSHFTRKREKREHFKYAETKRIRQPTKFVTTTKKKLSTPRKKTYRTPHRNRGEYKKSDVTVRTHIILMFSLCICMYSLNQCYLFARASRSQQPACLPAISFYSISFAFSLSAARVCSRSISH